mmetsp:Transcript_1851/g.215  ORF Transcript_1851/g.215 Transcript_1851/m.215 type:complete len:108 (+) Transcript_1851:841-1164(+)
MLEDFSFYSLVLALVFILIQIIIRSQFTWDYQGIEDDFLSDLVAIILVYMPMLPDAMILTLLIFKLLNFFRLKHNYKRFSFLKNINGFDNLASCEFALVSKNCIITD